MLAATHNMVTIACPRCGGAGVLEVFVPVNGGECFECEGAGTAVVSRLAAPRCNYPQTEAEAAAVAKTRAVKARLTTLLAERGLDLVELTERVGISINEHGVRIAGSILPAGLTYSEIAARIAAAPDYRHPLDR